MTKKSGMKLPVKLMAAAAGVVDATDARATGERTPRGMWSELRGVCCAPKGVCPS